MAVVSQDAAPGTGGGGGGGGGPARDGSTEIAVLQQVR